MIIQCFAPLIKGGYFFAIIPLLRTLMSSQLYIYLTAVSICFILSCFASLKKSTVFYLKAFVPFLLVTIIIEIFTTALVLKNESTTFIYNLSTTLEIVFYLFVLLNILRGKFIKTVISISTITYPILSLIDIYFIKAKGNFHTVSYAFGCLLIIIFSLSYFLELFAKPQITRLSKDSAFWICTGLLFFYSVTFPLYVSINFMITFPPIIANNLQYILVVLNVLLYLLFSIAFVCRIKIKKS